jgi:SAM-dependent methyltransferase
MDPPASTLNFQATSDDLAAIEPELRDLSIPREDVAVGGEELEARGGTALLLTIASGVSIDSALIAAISRTADETLEEQGILLLLLHGERDDRVLAELRNHLWPLLHVSLIYRRTSAGCFRRTLGGVTEIPVGEVSGSGSPKVNTRHGVLLVARRRTHALSPETTVEKFDQNAGGWNGEPGTPGYPHFRWMRRLVGCFAPIPFGSRILDFGCGAGWCGIEAALRFRASELAFFDPSPEMVQIAEKNAKLSGIQNAVGRTGFGESPPFPGRGEAPYDAVISSGVISFSPDPDRWLDGLVGTIAPGGALVIGDIHHDSRGNRRRRTCKPLLPGRELNALTPDSIRSRLEERGFRFHTGAGYQLTRPFPEAMYVNETRLGGVLTRPLLWSNQLAATASRRIGLPGQDQFDSWVMHFKGVG